MTEKPIYRIAVVAFLVVAVIAVISSKNRRADMPAGQADSVPAPAASDATGSPAPTGTVTRLPRMLDLGGETCKVCQKMAPILEELRREQAGKIEIEFVDVWKDPSAAEKYGITLIPTQIFFDANGKEFFRHEGFFGKEEILEVFRKHGVDIAESSRKG